MYVGELLKFEGRAMVVIVPRLYVQLGLWCEVLDTSWYSLYSCWRSHVAKLDFDSSRCFSIMAVVFCRVWNILRVIRTNNCVDPKICYQKTIFYWKPQVCLCLHQCFQTREISWDLEDLIVVLEPGKKLAKFRELYGDLGIKCQYLGNYSKKTHTYRFAVILLH